jgi:hypothetical protein
MTESLGTNRRGTADIVYDAFYSGAIGGSIVALFFLFVDLIRAEPLFTPSLMGSVLFGGAEAAAVRGVDLGMVALYSIFHFASFAILGTLASLAVHEVELHSKHPALVLALLFLIFEGAFGLVAALAMPGAIAQIGTIYVAVANLLAAAGMAIFFMTSHQPRAWRRIRGSVRI